MSDGSWVRGLIRLKIEGRQLEIKQQPWVIEDMAWSKLRGQRRHTTNIAVLDTPEAARAEANRIAEGIAQLLCFATASEVAVAGWQHEIGTKTLLRRSVGGGINYFIPVIETSDGTEVRRFLESVWGTFIQEETLRNLPAVFHYLALSEREDTPVELKLAMLLIVLEQLKHSFAVSNCYVFIAPWFHVPGTTKATRKSKRNFEKLLKDMFGSVGMGPSLASIVDLRNEILHSGLSARPFDELTVMEGDILAVIREYLLRLLGYTGSYYTGQNGGVRAVI